MDKSLRQAYDYWQDQPDNSHGCTGVNRKKTKHRGAPGDRGNTAQNPPGGERQKTGVLPRFPAEAEAQMRNHSFTNARVSQLSSTSRQQSVSAVLWTPGSHQAVQAALMLLPFRSTDPKQCMNPQSQMPKATNEPSNC